MKKLLKFLNPFIWLLNFWNYQVHLEAQHILGPHRYVEYDFSCDIKYF